MWRIVWTYFRLGVLNELGYRANFFIQLFQSLLELGAAIAGVAIVFAHTDELGGWRQAELIALLVV
jgi:ABC-2 type transport system permease protein